MPEGVLFQIGNFNVGPTQLLMFAASVVFFIAVVTLSNMYWKRRLTKWARASTSNWSASGTRGFTKGHPRGPAAATSMCSVW